VGVSFLFLGIALSLLPYSALHAKSIIVTEVEIGQARLRPSLSGDAQYMSNINFADKHPKGSMVYRVTPGLSLDVPLERLYFGVSADACYTTVDKGDETWTSQGHAGIRYNLTNQTSVGLSHDYSRSDLYGLSSGNTSDLHHSVAMIKHQFSPKLTLSLSGSDDKYGTHVKDGTDKLTDYKQGEGAMGIEYRLTPRTTFSLGGDYGRRDYKGATEKEYKFWDGTVGITQMLTPRITLGLTGGYQDRNYKIGEDTSQITYSSTITVILSNFSTLYISYGHSLQDTFYPKDPNILKNPFGVDDTRVNLLNENYKFVKTDHIGLNLTYRLTDKDTLQVGGAYVKSRSGQDLGGLVSSSLWEKLKEESYYGGLQFSHKFTSWLALDVIGSYGVRNSNVREKYDYYSFGGGMSLSLSY
jgi:hypothetical protein